MYPYSRIAMKVAIGALGVAVLIPWFTTQGTYVTTSPTLQKQPQVFTVCPDGPPKCQFAKIQEAIDAAPDPQSPYWEPTAEIQVAPGTYEESLQLIHKVVLLKGAGKNLVFVRTPHIYKPVLLIAGATGFSSALIEEFTFKGDIALAGGPVGAHILHNKVLGSIIVTGSLHAVMIEENDFQKGDEGCGISALGLRAMHIQSNLLQGQCWIAIEQARLNNPLASTPKAPGERILIKGNRGGRIVIRDSSAVAIQKNITDQIYLRGVETALVEENKVQDGGIEVDSSSDVVIKRNMIERNYSGILVSKYATNRKAAVAILENYVVQNEFGIATDELEYIVECRGNEVKENKSGDYIVGWPDNPRPSLELKDKCEKS
jgi:hypothetical protein